jgi:GDP-L-fucose synthase
MIHRAFLTKRNNEKMVVWGDGSPLRQVIYADDLANLIIWSLYNWKNDLPFMAINEIEYSILDISKIICNSINIDNDDIVFDSTKPMGQHRKPAISNAPKEFNFTKLENGIKETIDWFVEHYDIIRK